MRWLPHWYKSWSVGCFHIFQLCFNFGKLIDWNVYLRMTNKSEDSTTFHPPKADVYLESEYKDASHIFFRKCYLTVKKFFNVNIRNMVIKPMHNPSKQTFNNQLKLLSAFDIWYFDTCTFEVSKNHFVTRIHSSRKRPVRCSGRPWGRCLPAIEVSACGGEDCLPDPPWTESQTHVKTLPCHNYVADGNKQMSDFWKSLVPSGLLQIPVQSFSQAHKACMILLAYLLSLCLSMVNK